MMESTEQERAVSSIDEQIIVFYLDKELFGINLSYINEIIELPAMNVVPRSPEFISGVINNHGRIVAVQNLASFFNLTSSSDSSEARIIELVPGEFQIAFLVDRVKEITQITAESEEVNPMKGDDFKNIYVDKVVCLEKNPINIIDVDKLLVDLEDYFKEVNLEH